MKIIRCRYRITVCCLLLLTLFIFTLIWNRTQNSKVSADLVILVLSSAENFHRREAIRLTWLQLKSELKVHCKFVVGLEGLPDELKHSLTTECEEKSDLLILNDVADSYDSLTTKLITSFGSILKTFDFKFVVKCDDDSFINLPLFAEALRRQARNRLYWGFFDGRAPVIKRGKWQETKWNLCDRYLPYALGGGYVLSEDLVRYIVTNSVYLNRFKGEDISVGLWLSPLSIHRVHDENFDTEFASRGCSNSYVITHKQTPEMMKEKYENIKRFGRLCKSEYKRRESYFYDWNVLPSQCCKRQK